MPVWYATSRLRHLPYKPSDFSKAFLKEKKIPIDSKKDPFRFVQTGSSYVHRQNPPILNPFTIQTITVRQLNPHKVRDNG